MQYDIRPILERIKPSDRVLEVGGWWEPFPRADAIIDLKPYDPDLPATHTTNVGHRRDVDERLEAAGRLRPRVGRDDWYQGDACNEEVWQRIGDKQFDYVVCSHLLEDVRDPLFVCSQLIRVAKAGYIECPSRFREASKQAASDPVSGYDHHRWVVQVVDDALVFSPKLHWYNTIDYLSDDRRHLLRDWRFHFTPVFWEDSFVYHERMHKGARLEGANLLFFFDRYDYESTHIERELRPGPAGSRSGVCLMPEEYELEIEKAPAEVRDRYLGRFDRAVESVYGRPPGRLVRAAREAIHRARLSLGRFLRSRLPRLARLARLVTRRADHT